MVERLALVRRERLVIFMFPDSGKAFQIQEQLWNLDQAASNMGPCLLDKAYLWEGGSLEICRMDWPTRHGSGKAKKVGE